VDSGNNSKIAIYNSNREEEKRMLRQLNDRHLKIITEKQADIECLQQKLATLEQFRFDYIEEVERSFEEKVKLLERKISELEDEKRDLQTISCQQEYTLQILMQEKKELEAILLSKEQKLLIISELNEEICNLKAKNDTAEEKYSWIKEQWEKDKETFEQSFKTEFLNKWETLASQIESGWKNEHNLDELKKMIEECRLNVDNSEENSAFKVKCQEKLKCLEESLEKEREMIKSLTGEKSDLGCKLENLKEELEFMKTENRDMKQRLLDEKCVQVKRVSEMEEEIRQLKSKHYEFEKLSVCNNGCPVSLKPEIKLYGKLLTAREAADTGMYGRRYSASSTSSDEKHINARHTQQGTRKISIASMGQKKSTRKTFVEKQK